MKNKKIRLLIVDDSRAARMALKTILEDEKDIGVVGEAHDGRSAMEAYDENTPDIILMDIKMPNMNGIEASRKILAKNPGVKIIALTSFGGESLRKELAGIGVDSLLSKDSLSYDTLIEKITGGV